MKMKAGLACAVAVLASFALSAQSALAAPKTVCSSGCSSVTIQGAINSAASGATITIAPGAYYEDIKVTKPVTLKGSGPSTVVYPGVSNPECEPGSLCEGAASNIVEVEASNVTIEGMTLDGNNPKLTSGVVVEGQDIDARNGVIVNFEAGSFTNLTVQKTIVRNIFLRGIYESESGSTFNFNHDVVENVQGNESSIAMFAFEAGGAMDHNTVANANDAISTNWSTGTEFAFNKISKSGSGIHTDNNGGAFAETAKADTIKDNKVTACKENGYGIFVFVPYLSATVEANKVSGCTVALAAFGGAVAGEGPKFVDNKISGLGASKSEAAGPYGAYLTTNELGFGNGELNATLTGNKFDNVGVGMVVSEEESIQATVTAEQNQFNHDPIGAIGEPGTVVKAQNNWWGCRFGPNAGSKCSTTEGTVEYTPFRTSR